MGELQGVIAEKREYNGGYQILVIPNLVKQDIINKTDSEITALAQKNDGVNFYISTNEYRDVKIGTQVIVYYDLDAPQEDSDPPQRGSIRIEIIK